MGLPNIANLTTVLGQTSGTNNLNTYGTTVMYAPPLNHTYKINTVIASNKTAAAVLCTLVLNRNTTQFLNLAYNITLPANATLVLIGKDNPFYMTDTSNDQLSASASSLSAVDMIISYEEIF